MVIVIIIAVLVLLALFIAGAAGVGIETASIYLQALNHDDRQAPKKGGRRFGKLRYWLTPNEYKQCRGCCVFCKYFECCLLDVSEKEAAERWADNEKL